jgi:peptidyl-prolyl cis-trans isomerase SurA
MQSSRYFFIVFLSLFSLQAKAELLDKISAVMNDQIITLSKAKRAVQNLNARRDISPQIYINQSYTDVEMSKILVQRLLVRAKLEELGYMITDDQVEGQITATERRLGVSRQDLLEFLRGNQMTFDEYFEVIRETIEFNLFYTRVIQPLVTVSEQEVKNEFFKRNIQNQSLAFRYNLLSFSLHQRYVTRDVKNRFQAVLENFRNTGILPQEFSEIVTTPMGEITEDGLSETLIEVLKNTDEGQLSEPVLMGESFHVFLVQAKDLVESEIYLRQKERIFGELMEIAAIRAIDLWYQREENKYYIRYF